MNCDFIVNECVACCCRRYTLLLSIASICCHNERAPKSNDRTKVPNERNNWACPTKQIASTEQVRCVNESSVRCTCEANEINVYALFASEPTPRFRTQNYIILYYVNEYTPMSTRMGTSVRKIFIFEKFKTKLWRSIWAFCLFLFRISVLWRISIDIRVAQLNIFLLANLMCM